MRKNNFEWTEKEKTDSQKGLELGGMVYIYGARIHIFNGANLKTVFSASTQH